MGLVTKRNLQLDKLFDQLAVDPKKKQQKPTDKSKDNQSDQSKENDQ